MHWALYIADHQVMSDIASLLAPFKQRCPVIAAKSTLGRTDVICGPASYCSWTSLQICGRRNFVIQADCGGRSCRGPTSRWRLQHHSHTCLWFQGTHRNKCSNSYIQTRLRYVIVGYIEHVLQSESLMHCPGPQRSNTSFAHK